ncbi:MAG: methyltransferase domain-containing protein [Anaerolineales bacterium]|nr:methyltransferase domain-containing protein [Anaerolineales bacterium]
MSNRQAKDFLFKHLQDLPYFRALLRAVESSFYEGLPLPEPVYDVGCGDGHFASVTFDKKLDVGLDPWRFSMRDAKQYDAYKSLVEADGALAPFPSNHFASGVSNSVLEHILQIDEVLKETARVLQPGAPFYFCVPNHTHFDNLALAKIFGKPYVEWFRYISRTKNADSPEVWNARLERAGFVLEKWWHYFSPAALHALEWGHYFGLPSVVARALTGKWVIARTKWNLGLVESYLQKYASSEHLENGTYTFFIARKK